MSSDYHYAFHVRKAGRARAVHFTGSGKTHEARDRGSRVFAVICSDVRWGGVPSAHTQFAMCPFFPVPTRSICLHIPEGWTLT